MKLIDNPKEDKEQAATFFKGPEDYFKAGN